MKKVLFIDDEEDILEVGKIILENEGIEVVCMTDLKTVDEVVEIKPDLVLLDLLLLGHSGDEICTMLNEDVRTKDIPIIIISAYNLSRVKELTKNCTARAFIQKPFDIDAFVEKIKAHLG
jgi:DNA-binding response OmpR family regulator